jgi:hypothetical protein
MTFTPMLWNSRGEVDGKEQNENSIKGAEGTLRASNDGRRVAIKEFPYAHTSESTDRYNGTHCVQMLAEVTVPSVS